MTKSKVRVLCTVACMPLVAACYSYTAVPIERIPVGTAVRVRITGAEADQLSQQLGRDQDRTIDGELVEKGDDALMLSVPSSTAPGAGSAAQLFQRVALPRNAVMEFEVRRLQGWKTGGIIALATAVVGYVALREFSNQNASPGPGKGGANK